MKIRDNHNIYLKEFDYVTLRILTVIYIMIAIITNVYSAEGQNGDIEVDTAIFMREAYELQELLVRPQKEKYSKKNNPAVELVDRIRKDHKKGDPRRKDIYSFDQYDKLTLGLLDIPQEQLERHQFLYDFLDTTKYGKRPVLNILFKEKASTKLYSKDKKRPRTVIQKQSSSGLNDIFDASDISGLLEEFLREVDIYDDDITLMSNRFPSPLSSIGPDYYKYYITDTIEIYGTKCVQLTFSPRNPESFSFMGNLYVALCDTAGFIRKVSMKVPRTINLNYVDNLYIDQLFEIDSLGFHHKVEDELNLDLSIIKGTQPFFAHRKSDYRNFSYKKRKDLSQFYEKIGNEFTLDEESDYSKEFLSQMRNENLTRAESNMSTFMPQLREIPFFYWAEKAIVILVGGYIKTGKKSKFDIGPVNTLISTNPIEGLRLRLGGLTTANLSEHLFARGYVSYGTRDHKWKYKGELEYSFSKKKYHSREFPINSFRGTYMYDIDMIGQHYHFTNPDNVFLSLKRMSDRLATYRHLARIEYNIELQNQLSLTAWGEHIRQESTIYLPFIDGYGNSYTHYGRTSLGISIRYAPGERFIQEKGTRLPVNQDTPIILFTQEWGSRAFPGSDYTLCKSELSVQKRFWLSAFGYLDAIFKGGIIWTKVPYTELLWPNANLSYTIQPESYSLMNPMEFAMDKYVSCDLTYWGNGVLFNRIPYVKKTKLREVLGFKGIIGRLGDKNQPLFNPDLFRFPADCKAQTMSKRPYLEASVGVDNIFSVLRIDYVWRLTYRNVPGIDRSGLRVSLHFNF